MTPPTAIPVDQYLRTYYEPDREYVSGHLVERNVGECTHSRMQALIGGKLASQEAGDHKFRTFFSLRIRVSDEPRYRIPDVCVKAWPHQITPELTCPDLAIEIVSPEDEVVETLDKLADYIAAAIPHIWLVGPYKRILTEVVHGRIRRPATRVLATPLVGKIDFAALFAELDEHAE
jgi:Uma2 family endonuclease